MDVEEQLPWRALQAQGRLSQCPCTPGSQVNTYPRQERTDDERKALAGPCLLGKQELRRGNRKQGEVFRAEAAAGAKTCGLFRELNKVDFGWDTVPRGGQRERGPDHESLVSYN